MRRATVVSCLSIILTLHSALQVGQIKAASLNDDNVLPTSYTATNTTTLSPTTTDITPIPTSTTPSSIRSLGKRIKLRSDPGPSTPTPTPTPAPKPSDCPTNCTCVETRITCEGKKLKGIPNLSKLVNIKRISFSNNFIEELDLNKLPLTTLEDLDLSFNLIKNFTALTKTNNPSKLKNLNLRSNRIESLEDFAKIKFPSLESLDLSKNPLKVIDAPAFNNTKNLTVLDIQQTNLTRINEFAFSPLTEIREMNISYANLAAIDLGPKLFSRNQKLSILDLTNNSLTEVPHVLRSTSSINTLILNGNLMTSLRQSDFINRTKLHHLEVRRCPRLNSVDSLTFSNLFDLTTINITDNPRLQFISKDAFKSDGQQLIELSYLDLSGNNISTLSNLYEFPSLRLKAFDLSKNPWSCNCDQKWLALTINSAMRVSSLHCNSPPEYKDIEISHYFSNVDCEQKESSGKHTFIVALFLIFLLGLTIAVVVQKQDLCRRLLWRDQYGTIYYTKASFPPETA